MPIRKDLRHYYRSDWVEIADQAKRANGYRCQKCNAQHGEILNGVVIQIGVAHLNHIPGDNRPENLAVLCRGCHLRYDALHHALQRRRNQRAAQLAAGQTDFLSAFVDIEGKETS